LKLLNILLLQLNLGLFVFWGWVLTWCVSGLSKFAMVIW